MKAPADTLLLLDAYRCGVDDANRWRGRLVNLYARGELVIGQALLAQPDAKPLPMLLSQRIARLASSIEGQIKKAKSLRAFDELTRERNLIVHGAGKIYLDREGKWLLSLHAIDRSGPIGKVISRADGEKQVTELKVAVDRLSAAFRN